MENILITGGAGFMGCYLCDELLSRGYKVTVLDNLSPHVHGLDSERPERVSKDVELVVGDIRDVFTVEPLVKKADAVFHLAAIGSNGKSMDQIQELNDVNNIGTSVLIESIIRNPVRKLIFASSLSIYGEGTYTDSSGGIYQNLNRSPADLMAKKWDFHSPSGELLIPLACKEDHIASLDSVYALTKYDQEKLCMLVSEAYNIPVVSLRFFNVYGPGQSFESRYSDVMSGFVSRFINKQSPLVLEDGNQLRDFIYISDAVKACRLALELPTADGEIINVGSGEPRTILSLAQYFTDALDSGQTVPLVTEQYRFKEARHCFADISKAEKLLGFQPEIEIEQGIGKAIAWLEDPALINEIKRQLD
ncbi:NAD-dependent epimerase/dehydratase family protein [Algoriphagus resistens]|uniref:NAD-dependent epimerase/dehydratase family protein n=1 Tax=Algoriphagus resistens TaxID=1750590 RepID=UPI000716B172|nr:NAD-dependent epimerase/dehydratase family protein [Algoriphagus resistens]